MGGQCLSRNSDIERGGPLNEDTWVEGGHYGLGGQIIKNSKGHKKLRQRAQNSGKTQEMI